MDRRSFSHLAALAPAFAASSPRSGAALVTHADGPHLSAYIEGLAKTDDVSTVWLADPSGSTEAAVRKGIGAKLAGVYKTPRDLFAAHQPAIALVTMEAAEAPPAISAALDAGCHVMAEKPACVRAADFEPLEAKARALNLNLMLAFANRIDPVMMEARRIVHSGALGKMYGMEMHIIADQTRLTRPQYHETWIAKKARAGGGHLIWLGIHWLDLAMYITGSSIVETAGFSGNVGGQPIDTEDSAAVALRFDNGTFGTLTSGYYLDRGKQLFIKVWGSHGWLEIRHATKDPLVWYSSKDAKPEEKHYSGPATPGGYTEWVRHVVRAALGKEKPILTGQESLRALRTVFSAYTAAGTGRTTRVS